MMRSLAAAFVMGAFAGILCTMLAMPRMGAMSPVARDLVTIARDDLVQLQQAAESMARKPDGARFETPSGSLAMVCLGSGECNLEVPARNVARTGAGSLGRQGTLADARESTSADLASAREAGSSAERELATVTAAAAPMRIEIGGPRGKVTELESESGPRSDPGARQVRYIESELDSVDADSNADPQALPVTVASDDPSIPRLVTPLDHFDLRKGDVILEVDGKVITSPLEAFSAQRGAKELIVRRDGKEVKLKSVQ